MSEAAESTLAAPEPWLVHKLAAEVLGTFVLVFFGVGTALVSGGDYVATGLAFGLAVLVMAYAVGHISGGHFNPAVSVGAGMSGRIAWPQVGLYVAAQFAGALVAGVFLFALLHGVDGFEAEGNMGQNFFGNEAPQGRVEYAVWAAFLLELLLTAMFLYVILAVTDKRNSSAAAAPVAIGLALTLIHFASMGFTGTSVNPARSVGVGLFAGSDAIIQLWLFILAPVLGAAIAGFTYPLVFGRDVEPVPGSGLNFSRPAHAPAGWQGQQQWGQQEGWGGEQQWGQQGSQSQQWGQAQGGQQQAGEQQWGGQQQAQTEYPGWQWDAQAQQWVPDPATQQQWPAQGAEGEESPRTQIRDPEGPAHHG